jgi:hypothetical protein
MQQFPPAFKPRAASRSSLVATRHCIASSRQPQALHPLCSVERAYIMRTLVKVIACTLTALPMLALAAAKCPAHPKEEWMKPEEARAKLEGQGYKIKKFKVDGECYEIYGRNKDGKKVEIYFDTKTLDIVKSEIEN